MEEQQKRRRARRTDEELLEALEQEAKRIKARLESKKAKDYIPICNNLGKLLVEMSEYDILNLSQDQKNACKKESAAAKALVVEMAKLIAAKNQPKEETPQSEPCACEGEAPACDGGQY